MLNGGMQGCRGYGETKGGGGMQKPSTVEFHKNCKLNLLFILILGDKCVVRFLFFFFFGGGGKNWKRWNRIKN